MSIQHLQYPIGKFTSKDSIEPEDICKWIDDIEQFPQRISGMTQSLSDDQLKLQYRPEGWTIRQVVHHCADSHMNAFLRFKWALTEDKPKIKPYFEDKWAVLPDTTTAPVMASLELIKGLHERWTMLCRSLHSDDLHHSYVHPELGKEFTLSEAIALYSWHGRHHLAHIELALKNK